MTYYKQAAAAGSGGGLAQPSIGRRYGVAPPDACDHNENAGIQQQEEMLLQMCVMPEQLEEERAPACLPWRVL